MQYFLTIISFLFFSTMSLKAISVKAEAFIKNVVILSEPRAFLTNGEGDESLLELYLGVEPDDFVEDDGLGDYNELLNVPDEYMKEA
ncbi:MAG TPA: hypothetical protein DD412_04080 [Holosporales bacterium]|nr:hypothetical protein [Holosporales bacterium]